jgi:hypothetical protein
MTNLRIGQSRSPDFVETLRSAMSQAMNGLFVALPGKVEVYNPTTQTATVKPLLQRAYIDDQGNEGLDDLAAIPNVPIMFPRAGGFFLSFPLVPNDNVLLLFMDRSIDSFMVSTGTVALDPVDLREHDLSDAIAIPGFFPTPKAITDVIATGAAFGKEKGPQVRASNNAIEITTAGSPTSTGGFVAMAAKVDDFITKLDTVFNTWVPVLQDGGTALQTKYQAIFSAPPATTASTNLKAD